MPRHHQMIVDVAHNGQQLQIVTEGRLALYKCLLNGTVVNAEATPAVAMRWLAGFIEDNSLDEPIYKQEISCIRRPQYDAHVRDYRRFIPPWDQYKSRGRGASWNSL